MVVGERERPKAVGLFFIFWSKYSFPVLFVVIVDVVVFDGVVNAVAVVVDVVGVGVAVAVAVGVGVLLLFLLLLLLVVVVVLLSSSLPGSVQCLKERCIDCTASVAPKL